MIDCNTRDLVRDLVNEMMSTYVKECKFGNILRSLSEADLNEMAYFIEDTINSHRPSDRRVQLYRIERYIAHHLRKAQWHVTYDDLMEELRDIANYDYDLMDDLDDQLDEAVKQLADIAPVHLDEDVQLNALEVDRPDHA